MAGPAAQGSRWWAVRQLQIVVKHPKTLSPVEQCDLVAEALHLALVARQRSADLRCATYAT